MLEFKITFIVTLAWYSGNFVAAYFIQRPKSLDSSLNDDNTGI